MAKMRIENTSLLITNCQIDALLSSKEFENAIRMGIGDGPYKNRRFGKFVSSGEVFLVGFIAFGSRMS
jgi:hypothetical protein